MLPEIASQVKEPSELAEWNDAVQILDEEIQSLTTKYREPLILLYWGGLTQDEIASKLECPRKTVTTRIARARQQLQGRLHRRGITLSLVALGGLLSQESRAAPETLIYRSIQDVPIGNLSPSSLTLAKGVIQSMYFDSIKKYVLTIGFILFCMGTGFLLYSGEAAEPVVSTKLVKEVAKDPPPLGRLSSSCGEDCSNGWLNG